LNTKLLFHFVVIHTMEKIKKLTVPKAFLRNHNVLDNGHVLDDNLDIDTPILQYKQIHETLNPIDVSIPLINKDNDKKSKRVKNTEVKRKPSAYNIFVKENLEILKNTHKHLTAKEQFHMAIFMWNESKIK